MDLSENNARFFSYVTAHPWEVARRKFIMRQISHFLPDGGNILDVGCGNCYIANGLSHIANFKVTGIDTAFTPEMLKSLQIDNLNGIRLYQRFEDIDESVFNAVLLLDVLEHVEDDVDTLVNLSIKPEIAPGAIFFITVPAFSCLFSTHDRKLGHYRRYTCNSLVSVATASNMEILTSGYFFTSLLAPVMLCKLMELFRLPYFKRSGVGAWNHHQWITDIIAFFLNTDTLLGQLFNYVNIKIPGLSCYLICRKPQ
jgi:SAM-dependent methyltransferase